MRTCSIPDCGRPVRGRGYCNRHLLRLRRHGDPLGGRPSWDDFTIPTEKACRRCQVVKPLDEFATRSAARDGKSPWCKVCFTDHYYANPDLHEKQRREWNAAHPDYFADYYRANRARRIAQVRAWSIGNPEKRMAWWQTYKVEYRDKINERSRNYQRRVGHKYSKARTAKKKGAAFVELVEPQEVYRRAGGLCGICAEPVDPSTFHVDHIIPLARGGEHSYANTQPAHPVCNLRKGARVAA